MNHPISTTFALIGGVSTRILEVTGDGPTIVLLHGFSDSADTWRPVLTELASMGRRAVAVDLPGGGHADPLARPALRHLDAFVDDVVRRYAEGGAIVAGNSLGGLLALRVATREDKSVRGVVGIGPAGLMYGWRLVTLARLLRCLDRALRILDRVPVPEVMVRRGAERLHSRVIVPVRGRSEHARRYAAHVHGMHDVARLRNDMLTLSRELDTNRLALERIRVPVLLIWGRRDRLTNLRGAAAFLAAVPASNLEVLEHCGHCPQLEEPRLVAEAIASAPVHISESKAEN